MQPEQDHIGMTLADPVAESARLMTVARDAGLTLRLLGGVAVRVLSPHAAQDGLARTYGDLDFVGSKKQSKAIRDTLETSGYAADRRFNALHGAQRLLFLDEARRRQIDIFLGTFEMCHKLSLEDRLQLYPLTLSPADLLLTKLQIVQLNRKDAQDVLALLLDYPPSQTSPDIGHNLDVSYIARLASRDWGWYTTLHDNLDRVAEMADELLAGEDVEVVRQRVRTLKDAMDQAPKSLGWKARDAIGRRVAWYEMPEEVRR